MLMYENLPGRYDNSVPFESIINLSSVVIITELHLKQSRKGVIPRLMRIPHPKKRQEIPRLGVV